jgi:hypothetical protein
LGVEAFVVILGGFVERIKMVVSREIFHIDAKYTWFQK